MHVKRKLIALSMSVAVAATPIMSQEQSWFCKVEAAGGVTYRDTNSGWRGTAFGTERTYLISPAAESFPDNAYSITEVGNSFPEAICEFPPDETGFMSCGVGNFVSAYFNEETLWLQLNYIFDSVSVDLTRPADELGDVFIEIAVCSPF